MGCRGPETYNNCPVPKFNDGTSWPIEAGHPCIGCSEPESLYMPRGFIKKRDIGGVTVAKQARVTEHVARAWYKGKEARHPFQGETNPLKENPQYRPGGGMYSWFKAPRYNGEACEVGPLSRVLVAYANGHKDLKPPVLAG